MPARLGKSLGLLLILSLLLAACQPIQPIQPTETAVAGEATTAPKVSPAIVERNFPTTGVAVSLPEEWVHAYNPALPILLTWSAAPPPEPQKAGGYWEYLMEEPIAAVSFVNLPSPGSAEVDLAQLLQLRFRTAQESLINPIDNTKIIEEPTLLTINGQPAAKMVVEGMDAVLQKPFRAYVWAIRNGSQILYIASALLEQNEAAFVPLVEQIAESVIVSQPQPAAAQAPTDAGEIAPGLIVTGALRRSLPDQVLSDYWRFVAEPGKRYTFTATPTDRYKDIVIDIVDAAGKSVLGREVDAEGDGAAETLTFVPREGGDYYVALHNFFLGTGGYTLELQEAE